MHHCPACGVSLKKFDDLELGSVKLTAGREIFWRGERVDMMPSSQFLYDALIRNAGRVFERDSLLKILDSEGDIRTIDAYINRGRRAFEKLDPNFKQLGTIRGVGYVWLAEAKTPALRLAA